MICITHHLDQCLNVFQMYLKFYYFILIRILWLVIAFRVHSELIEMNV